MFGSSPTIFKSVLAASSVTPRVLLMSAMRSMSGPVAPFTAASVACFSCSGVSLKLQVTVLPVAVGDGARPRLDRVSESDRRLLAEGNRQRDRSEESGARHGFGDGAAGGGQFTVLPVAVPLFATLQSPDFTLVPAEVIAANILSHPHDFYTTEKV